MEWMEAENAVKWIEMKIERARAAGAGVRVCRTAERGEEWLGRRIYSRWGGREGSSRVRGKRNRAKERGEADCGSGKGHRMNVWAGLELEVLHKGWGLSARALRRVWHLALTDWQNRDQAGIKEWGGGRKRLGTSLNTASLVPGERQLRLLGEAVQRGEAEIRFHDLLDSCSIC